MPTTLQPSSAVCPAPAAGGANSFLVLPDPRPREAPTAVPSLASDLVTLTKLRLNGMVLITTAVGFYMADPAPGRHWVGMLHVLLGTLITAAASGVLNQWMEIDRDRKMPRTRSRPLPAGRMTPDAALALGVTLGLAGLGYLYFFCNPLTAGLGLLTLFTYLALYTPLKVRSTLNTIVGAIPGAIPPVMGCAAATGNLFGGVTHTLANGVTVATEPVARAAGGSAALALFGILFLWQMPHFLAIATMYRDDYRAGGYKMLPVIDPDLSSTVRQILTYCAALLLVSLTPTLFGMTGIAYAGVAMLLGIGFAMTGGLLALTRARKDARTVFFASIIYLPLLLTAMVLDKA